MDQLFSKGALREASSAFHHISIDREIALVKELVEDLHNGNMKDETRYEQNFNELFFHQLLGYKPKINLHPKASTPIGSKIADVGLGFFEEGLYSYEGVKVVVELKGSGTLLDKKQASYGGQSPVDQGFGYKTSFKDCPWLIVSNFATIRLYRDNKQDYQERTIDQLAQSDNDYFHLKTLLGLLKSNRLISSSGTSYTQTLLSEVRVKQEQITKQFYKDYKALRLELINDIRHHNSEIDVETVVEKAQKIIDRIVFIHFCEDKGLLPEGKLAEVINYGEKALSPTFQTLTNFFEAVNSGSERLEIPHGYNGGLFHTDAVVDSLKISNEICRKFVNLGRYDFDDELSVNILGHIFEQSISDIEQLKGELINTRHSEQSEESRQQQAEDGLDASVSLAGQELDPSIPQGDKEKVKKESKRKKDGIFYTPAYIVDYIVQNSLMVYLEEKEHECLKKYKNDEKKAYEAYKHILENVKVLDPACGSGAFLVKVFDYLYAENKRIGDILQQSGAIFSDDSIYKSILRNNIYGVDLNPESVEITKLSLWLKSAQKGKKLNNLDDNIKCGNSLIDDPAVAGERAFDRNQEFSDIMSAGGFDVIVGNPPYVIIYDIKTKQYLEKYYQSFSRNNDLYTCFFDKSLNLLKDSGRLGFITPNSFIRGEYFLQLRENLIKNQIFSIIDFHNELIFKDANVFSAITILSKKNPNFNWTMYKSIDEKKGTIDYKKSEFLIDNSIIKKLEKVGQISDYFEIKDVGLNYWTIGKGKKRQGSIGSRILYSGEKKNAQDIPYIKGSNFHKYTNISINNYMIHNFKEYLFENDVFRYSEKLLSIKPKILYRQTASSLIATIDYNGSLCDKTVHIIIPRIEIDLKILLVILNSSLINYIYRLYTEENGRAFAQVKTVNVKKLPFLEPKDGSIFIEKADVMLSLNKELHDKTDTFLRFISSKYGIAKLSTKLKKFYDYDFAHFLSQLKGVKLSLNDQAELMEFFESKKLEIVSLKNTIEGIDREIDEMVFELYGLSEEEREVVMGG